MPESLSATRANSPEGNSHECGRHRAPPQVHARGFGLQLGKFFARQHSPPGGDQTSQHMRGQDFGRIPAIGRFGQFASRSAG